MLSRLTAHVTGFLKSRRPLSLPEKGVPELLAALAEVRARKAQLDRQERDLIAATQARLLQHREELEALRKKVHDCGIAVGEDGPAPAAPSTIAAVIAAAAQERAENDPSAAPPAVGSAPGSADCCGQPA